MSKGGFSKSRLGRLRDALQRHIDNGAMPGAVALVSRHGETHVEAVGTMAFDGASMQRDTIFRIASMTKPITAVAAMMLVEESRLRLDDPVDEFLPELKDRRVLRSLESPLDGTVAATRPISLRDLLTMRMGLGMVMVFPSRHPIQKAMEEAGVAPGPTAFEGSAEEYMKRIGALPLIHQPGEQWLYHTSSDVLGVLIARASGQSLSSFMQTRIFEPLGMQDTGFHVPTAKIDRLATSYRLDPASGNLTVFDEAKGGRYAKTPDFEAGGSGLVSTVDDYLVFGQMLLNGGRLGSERLLSRPSMELMTVDHISAEQKARSPFFPGFWETFGWGFGMAVVTGRTHHASIGQFGWDGGYGTSGHMDPKEGLTGVLMTQVMMDSPAAPRIFSDFWTSAYQAIDN